jgi:hypothetical protein
MTRNELLKRTLLRRGIDDVRHSFYSEPKNDPGEGFNPSLVDCCRTKAAHARCQLDAGRTAAAFENPPRVRTVLLLIRQQTCSLAAWWQTYPSGQTVTQQAGGYKCCAVPAALCQ